MRNSAPAALAIAEVSIRKYRPFSYYHRKICCECDKTEIKTLENCHLEVSLGKSLLDGCFCLRLKAVNYFLIFLLDVKVKTLIKGTLLQI